MLGRIRRGPAIESHDLVTAARRRGAALADLGDLAEPLELLCRDLDQRAGLHAAGRRRVRGLLIDALLVDLSRQTAGSTPSRRLTPVVVIAGLDARVTDALASRLVASGAVAWPEPPELELCQATMATVEWDRCWHVPSWAEWFAGHDHSRLHRRWASPDGRPIVLRSFQHLEQLAALDAATDLRLVVLPTAITDDAVRDEIERVVTERRRWSDDVDAPQVRRYWAWRLETILEHVASWTDQHPTRVVRGTAVVDDRRLERLADQVAAQLDATSGGPNPSSAH